ncbi:alpha/beta hydrolase [Paenibacillus sp. 1001270B_150601_E10]|uniref:alpha/beta hydrolase n=1 Tax=Paenibacillus sp. 1001270B_150601_E10 TaxID=2787079 RepID=UPI00189F2FF6|nr:alpha/beta hydrolase [Paenibacillus sp. 1001270B_150601_E10]
MSIERIVDPHPKETTQSAADTADHTEMPRIPPVEKFLRGVISVIGCPLTFVQAILSRYTLHKYQAPGDIIYIGSHRLHAIVTGSSNHLPTIILESGMGGGALDWSLVQPELSKHTRVLSYDRAGFGWSTTTTKDPTCEGSVRELRSLLSQLNISPPYILVGHSYGGMIMRLFAAESPEEVSGVVLVDSTHESRFLGPAMNQGRKKSRSRHHNSLRLGYLFSPIGLPRLLKQHIGVKRMPPPIQRKVRELGYRNHAYKAAYLESLGASRSAVQLKNSTPLKSSLPLIVLTAGKQSEDWLETQKELLHVTNHTKQIIVEESWHSIQLYKPQAVIDSVIELLQGMNLSK